MSEETIYYLEMKSPSELSAVDPSPELFLQEAEIDNWEVNRFLYRLVGKEWQWEDKLPWTEKQWKEYVDDPFLRTWVAYVKGSIAGYFELLQSGDGNVEIIYFGLVSLFIGKGLGGDLLTRAVKQAWDIEGTKRVWLHTCSLDHPAALKNYQRRGFRLYKQEKD